MAQFESLYKKFGQISVENTVLSQCLEKGGKRLADTEAGFAKNAIKRL